MAEPATNDDRNLTIEGPLTIERTPQLKESIERLLSSGGDAEVGGPVVTLDLTEVTQIDMAGLQLLCASLREARRLEVQLTLVGAATMERLRRMSEFAGLSPLSQEGCGE